MPVTQVVHVLDTERGDVTVTVGDGSLKISVNGFAADADQSFVRHFMNALITVDYHCFPSPKRSITFDVYNFDHAAHIVVRCMDDYSKAVLTRTGKDELLKLLEPMLKEQGKPQC